MPVWLKIAAGALLGASLIGLAGLQGASKNSVPSCRNTARPIIAMTDRSRRRLSANRSARSSPRSSRCTPNTTISPARISKPSRTAPAISRACRRSTPMSFTSSPKMTKLRDGEMVLFIGLKAKCVSTVFGFPAKLYREILSATGSE